MSKLIYIIGLLIALSPPSTGQKLNLQYQVDASAHVTPEQKDSVFILHLLDSGKYYLNKQGSYLADLDSAAAYFRQAIRKSDSLAIIPLKYEGLCLLGIRFFEEGKNQQGRNYFMQVIQQYQLSGKKEQEAWEWFRMGYYLDWNSANYPEILECLHRALSLYRQSGNKELEIRVFKEIADVHLNQGKLEEAEQELLQVLAMYQSIGYRNLHYTYDLLSVVARLSGDLNNGLQYGLQCVESMEAIRDTVDAPIFYSRVAHIYRNLGEVDKSIVWYYKELNAWVARDENHWYMYRDVGYLVQQLIQQKQVSEALNLVTGIAEKYPPTGLIEKSSMAQALGHCYLAMKQYNQAERQYLTMIGELKGMEAGELTSEAQHDIGKFYVERQQFEKARPYLTDALAVPIGVANAARVMDSHQLLFKVDSAAGNYLSAIEHFRLNKALNDSLFNHTKSRQIEELQIQYETAKKEQDIALLQNESHFQQNQLQQARLTKNITIIGCLLLLVFVGLLFNQYRIKQRSNREISQKNLALEQLVREKDWLLKEIHHRVKNNLQVVVSLLNVQSSYLKSDDALQAFRESQHRMQAMSLIHQKLYQSDNIGYIDINTYIRELVSFLQDSFGTEHHFHFELPLDHLTMDVSQATPLGLILNEAISNALKYAFPGNSRGTVIISLTLVTDHHYQLRIADNGVGLPADFDVVSSHSLGMNLMQGLSKQLEGHFRWENNVGLTLIIDFPQKKSMAAEFISVGLNQPVAHA
uniref:histidine kinase n=1 Tax=Roseihalotalea indica TaxID=2867963 RepID=A0AA49JGM6_9BACT|nr:histidine kinase dimerization/phosphoacceptor domain -containing protein [Tunicatimonas sp. TK19036]